MRRFDRRDEAAALAATLTPGLHALDKGRYRISGSAAYAVPTAAVAEALLRELGAKRTLTHFDIDLFFSAHVGHFWFPSPFASAECAATSDVTGSAALVRFDRRYCPVRAKRRRRTPTGVAKRPRE
jgi:hypothetical protein